LYIKNKLTVAHRDLRGVATQGIFFSTIVDYAIENPVWGAGTLIMDRKYLLF
jgi:hypothetical protein